MRERRTQEERRTETRRKLLEATIRSLVDGGYPATTGRRVAELAGVSRGAQTHHFPQMSDLISEAVEHLAARRASELRRAARALRGQANPAPALIDLLWGDFTSDLFRAVVKLWVAAADDVELAVRLGPVERYLRGLVRSLVTDVMAELPAAHDALDHVDLSSRLDVVINAVRGHAVAQLFEPSAARRDDARWQQLRTQLIAILEAPAPAPAPAP